MGGKALEAIFLAIDLTMRYGPQAVELVDRIRRTVADAFNADRDLTDAELDALKAARKAAVATWTAGAGSR